MATAGESGIGEKKKKMFKIFFKELQGIDDVLPLNCCLLCAQGQWIPLPLRTPSSFPRSCGQARADIETSRQRKLELSPASDNAGVYCTKYLSVYCLSILIRVYYCATETGCGAGTFMCSALQKSYQGSF